MAYVRKTVDVWRLFVNYGQGWEYEGTDCSRQEAQQTLKSYRENCPQYPARIVFGRERRKMSKFKIGDKVVGNDSADKMNYNLQCGD